MYSNVDIERRKDILATVYLLGVFAAVGFIIWIIAFASVLIKKIFMFSLLILMVLAFIFVLWKMIRSIIE